MRSISPTWSVTRCLKLLVQSVEFLEQPRVLDGDDGLRSEVCEQFNLFVGEGTDLLAINGDRANQFVLLEHWYGKNGPGAGDFDHGTDRWVTFDVCLFRSEVGDVLQLLSSGDAKKQVLRARMDDRFTRTFLSILGRRAMHRRHPKCFIFIKEKITKFCVADAHRVFQHCREHGFEFARRTGDDLQYFRGGGLLLQRFTQLVEQPRVLDGDDGLRRQSS